MFVEGSGGPARGTRQQGAEGHPRNPCSHLQHLLLSPVPMLGRECCSSPHHELGGRKGHFSGVTILLENEKLRLFRSLNLRDLRPLPWL